MVRHNNLISKGHFHKDWQRYVRINFDKPFRKIRRNVKRARKARKLAPRPIDELRPIVRCPTSRYHSKQRLGRGFSLTEIKAANLNAKYARSIGIKVDHRRRTKSHESLLLNKQRIKVYLSKLVLFPLGKKKAVPEKEQQIQQYVEQLNQRPLAKKFEKARVVNKDEKKFCAFIALRQARGEMIQFRNQRKKKGSQLLDEK